MVVASYAEKTSVGVVAWALRRVLPIYLDHPDVRAWLSAIATPACCRRGRSLRTGTPLPGLAPAARRRRRRHTPGHTHPFHANQTIAVLEAGKHCACTVPMATSLDDLHRIVATQQRTGKTYMMMETAVYTREFLFVQSLMERGEIGGLQLLRGAHYQTWKLARLLDGAAPMHYATHAISPLLCLAHARPSACTVMAPERCERRCDAPMATHFRRKRPSSSWKARARHSR